MGVYKITEEMYPSVVELYGTGITIKEVAEHFSVNKATIGRLLKKLGVTTDHGHTRLARSGVNENFFSRPSKESDYVAGFLLADGNISDRGKVSINLKDTDCDVLFLIKKLLNLNSEVSFGERKTGEKSCQLVFTVQQIATDLNSLNIVPRKSLEEKAPEILKFSKDFWRGMVDGDGSVIPSDKGSCKIYLCGSESICQDFLDFCKSFCPSTLAKVCHQGGGLYRVSICGIYALAIAKVLYEDCGDICLTRKREKASQILAKYGESFHV
jgi:hypothetical protein